MPRRLSVVVLLTVSLLAPAAAVATDALASNGRGWSDGPIVLGTLAAVPLAALIIAAWTKRQSRRRSTHVAAPVDRPRHRTARHDSSDTAQRPRRRGQRARPRMPPTRR